MLTLEKAINSRLERVGISLASWDVRFLTSPFKIHEYQELVKGANIQQDHIVLDLGCGFGRQTQLIAKDAGRVVGVDVSRVAITGANRLLRFSPVKHKTEFICGSLETLNLEPRIFDRIVSFCVLEHITNLDRVLSIAHELLKPLGEIHASVDSLGTIADSDLIQKHRTDHAVFQYFDVHTIRKKFEQAGFEVQECYAILSGETARTEFMFRIQNGSRGNLFNRMKIVEKFREEDCSGSETGIMLIIRAKRPGTKFDED